MNRVPILKVGPFLFVAIQAELHDRMALAFQEDVAEEIRRTGARGVLIDVSALELVDSFIGRVVGQTAAIARMLSAATVLVGMRPEVAITIVELGMRLGKVHTAVDVESGLELLRRLLREDVRHAGALPGA